MMKLKIVKTVVTEKGISLTLADNPNLSEATAVAQLRLPHPYEGQVPGRGSRKALVGHQIEALERVRDALAAEIAGL